jgi:uncharacterized protein (TIGR04255 family)
MKTIEPKNIKYSKNFLKNVIFRIDFAPILSIKENLDSKFHDSIRSIFPKLEIQHGHQILTEFKEENTTSKTEVFNQYSFLSENNNIKLTISPQFIIMVVLEFSGFEEYKKIISTLLINFSDIYKPIAVTRLGLRYINEIIIKEGSPFSWREYINRDLIKILESDFILKGETARIMSQIIYNKENFNITFSFGIGNSEFPNPISRKEFILDFDCSSKEIEFDKIIANLEEYNNNMVVLFENSIEDGLRSILRGD